MKPTSTTALLGLLIAISACTSSRTAQDPASQTDQEATTGHDSHQHGAASGGRSGMHQGSMHEQMASMHDHMAERCPMRVEGATVTAVDTETGVALAFTTSGDVAELRRRVAEMAEHKKTMMSEGQGQMGMMHSGKGMQGAGMHGPRIEHTVQVVEIAGGAQLVLTPKQSSDLAALREQVREKSKMMQEGKCPMMKGHGAGPAHEHTASPPK